MPPPAVVEGMRQALHGLIEQNKAGFQALAQRGIQFDPVQILNARIDTVIQAVAAALGPQGEIWAIQANMLFEQLMAQHQQTANEQGRKAQLAVGGSFTPQMIRQLARETGTLGKQP